MCFSKGKKQRKAIDAGVNQANTALDKGVAAFQPYAAAGLPAVNNANALLGLGTQAQQKAANKAFQDSLFYKGGENAFGIEKDAIDTGLSNQGLLYSQVRENAVEEARRGAFQNALAQYIQLNQGQSGLGFAGASGQAGAYGNQAANYFNAALGKAGTYKGFAEKLGDAVSSVKNIASLANFGAGVFDG